MAPGLKPHLGVDAFAVDARVRRRHFVALVRGCGQAYALQTVEPVTYRCGTRRRLPSFVVIRLRGRDTRARASTTPVQER